MKDGELMEYDTPHRLINDEDTLFHKLWMEHKHHCKNSIE
jgi:ABC-type multidrug transport system fused ATPase/permease subunit